MVYIVMAFIVTACIVMAYIVMAYIVMPTWDAWRFDWPIYYIAYIGMAYKLWPV